jgi:serine/threonine protein kinase
VFLSPGYLAIATEYADGGGLADFQQRVENAGGMAEGPARALFQQMALALAFCHARGVTLGGFDLGAWLLDRAPARPILRQQSSGLLSDG